MYIIDNINEKHKIFNNLKSVQNNLLFKYVSCCIHLVQEVGGSTGNTGPTNMRHANNV